MMINKRLIGLCPQAKRNVLLTVASQLLMLSCNIAIIFLLGMGIDAIVNGETLDSVSSATTLLVAPVGEAFHVWQFLSVLLICIGGKFLAARLQGKFAYAAAAQARVRLRERLFSQILALGSAYQATTPTATLVQIAIEGIEQLEIYFAKYLPQFFYALLAPLLLFVVLAPLSWQSALVFICCVPLIPISIIAIMKMAKRILHAYWGNYADLGATFLENLQGLTTLKLFAQDEAAHEQMNAEAESFRKVTMKVLRMQLSSITVMDLIAYGGAAAGTAVALSAYHQGLISIGGVVIITLLAAEFFLPLRLLGSYFHIAMNGMAASEKIFAVLDTPVPPTAQQMGTPIAMQTLQVDQLQIAYDERVVLSDMCATFQTGQVSAIVGMSGSGKSTLAQALIQRVPYQAGTIAYDHQLLPTLARTTIMQTVGFVDAHSYIFTGTIADNLLLANPEASVEMMQAALKVARLADFVAACPDGLQHHVGEAGQALSGGQKQRLALARLILADRQVYIFDEATSNIDVESETAIWEAIYELGKTKMVIVITHRLANVVDADQIYVLANGTCVEQGTHATLVGQAGAYAQLVEQQQQLEQIREGR